jgi:regulator of replication initiation timing
VILEAVEPLTKKQFACFDGLDDLRRSLQHLYTRHDETVARLDKQVKRNEALDVFERKLKDLENELFIAKALQRNDNTLVLERVETLQTRLRVAQTDITAV